MIVRIGLIISVILNAILVMAILGVVPFLLYVSVLFNGVMLWFSIGTLRQTNEFENDVTELLESASQLQTHIETIHEMEMFYGDETLQGLIDHTREIVEEIDFYKTKYSELDEIYEEEEELDLELEMTMEEE